MKVDEKIEVTLTIEKHADDWWSVHVDDGGGGDFACSSASTAHHAVRGAAAYIECVIEDATGPLSHLLSAAAEGGNQGP